ncbi:hypothetical protein [Rhodovibrio salinarum]|uniref:Uncharacterized protein n=1 Tax=Rhodovibrio salinarum TaxID=1087 RepID=A0A934QIS2_9PROT|nr:hypothetical protein [Rhodovibrio salinarum]MBK1697472.1 hypothetical protein [Rhodovibrio salinarum]
MAQIINFPTARTAVAPAVKVNAGPTLNELIMQMRADSQALARSMQEMQAAVQMLIDADLPGSAQTLLAETGHFGMSLSAGVSSGR